MGQAFYLTNKSVLLNIYLNFLETTHMPWAHFCLPIKYTVDLR